jgi:hypothetical protein
MNCLNNHEMETASKDVQVTVQGLRVIYTPEYWYCPNCDTYQADRAMMVANFGRVVVAYAEAKTRKRA